MLATPTPNPIIQAALAAICPVGKVERMYLPVAGSGFLARPATGLGLTAYWVSLNSGFTIGSAASGANIAAAWAQQVYEHLWNNDTALALLTSAGGASTRGASAAADWAANKRLRLPDTRGRALIGIGQGGGLSNRALGNSGGAETHALSGAENGPHTHPVSDSGHTHQTPDYSLSIVSGDPIADVAPGALRLYSLLTNRNSGSNATGITIQSSGSGQAHNNMSPWFATQDMLFAGFA